MARFIDIHPVNPQQRAIDQVVDLIGQGALIAFPTDSGYALGAQIGNAEALDRIRTIRQLDDKHHFTLICRDFSQLGQFVHVDNAVFRAIKSATPGPYTFILPATREVPKRLLQAKKKTVGARIPDHVVTQAIVAALGEPILTSSLILPGHTESMSVPWEIKEALDHEVEAVIDTGAEVGSAPTTVIDFIDNVPEVVRVGSGDIAPFS